MTEKKQCGRRGLILVFALFMGLNAIAAIAQTDAYQEDIESQLVRKLLEAREMRKAGDLDGAEKVLNGILEIRPDYYRALYNLALISVDRHEYQAAAATFEKALAVQGTRGVEDPKIFSSLGWLYMQLKQPALSEKYLKKAEAHLDEMDEKTREGVLNNLGTLYLNQARYDLADQYFHESLDRFNSPIATQNMAVIETVRRRDSKYVSDAWFIILETFNKSAGWKRPQKLIEHMKELKLDAEIVDADRFSNLANGEWAAVLGPYPERMAAEKDLKIVKKLTRISDAHVQNGGKADPPR